MFELAFDALILVALYMVTPANGNARIPVFAAALVFVVRVVLLVLGNPL